MQVLNIHEHVSMYNTENNRSICKLEIVTNLKTESLCIHTGSPPHSQLYPTCVN